MSQTIAEFISEWDGGFQVCTRCTVDLLTGAVSPEVSLDEEAEDVEVLDREFIQTQDGREFELLEDEGAYTLADLPAYVSHVTAPSA